MKVSPNQNSIQSFRNNNVLPPMNNNRKSVAFGSAKGFIARTGEKIIDGDFLVNFLVVDALSMITPRIVIGLLRDRDKTGKINYKAGAEEAGREVISGPSMMFIPMGIMAAYKHFAPATHMQANTLKSFTNHMKDVVSNHSGDEVELNKKLADRLFDDAFANHDLHERNGLKDKFNELLNKSTNVEKKFFSKNKEYKEAARLFEEHVALINNQNMKEAPIDTKALILDTGLVDKENKKISANLNARELFEDFRNYSKDIVKKVANIKNGEETVSALEKMQRNRAFAKVSNGVVGFLAVGAFLLHLPKLYQLGKTSPAMESAKRAQKEAAQGGINENS